MQIEMFPNDDETTEFNAASRPEGWPDSVKTLDPVEMVDEFQKTFETPKSPKLWVKLVREELNETEQALAHFIKEFSDLGYVDVGYMLAVQHYPGEIDENDPTQNLSMDEMERIFRLQYIGRALREAYGNAVPVAFARVHESNMSKLGDDGKPIRRDDGKVMKGPNYKEPDILSLIVPNKSA